MSCVQRQGCYQGYTPVGAEAHHEIEEGKGEGERMNGARLYITWVALGRSFYWKYILRDGKHLLYGWRFQRLADQVPFSSAVVSFGLGFYG